MCLLVAITNTLAAPATIKATTKNTTLSSIATVTESESSLLTSVNKTEFRNSLLQLLSPQNSASHSRLRKRHSKRQSNHFDGFDLDVNSTVLEWVNTCGGYFDPTNVTKKKPNRTETLKELKDRINHTLDELNYKLEPIDTENFKMWSLYEYKYKFLPRLPMKCGKKKIALKRWYRHVRTYIATFAYLLRTQLKLQRSKPENDELTTLLGSARSVLCDLEIAINKTHPNHLEHNHLPQITRDEMNKHLQLITRQKVLENPNIQHEVNSIDFIFSKVYFKRFLKNMRKTIMNKGGNKVDKNCARKSARKGHSNNTNTNVHSRRKQRLQHNRA